MITLQKKSTIRSAFAASLICAAALTAVSVSAYAAPSAANENVSASKGMHKVGHHKGHGKHRGGRHGMRSLLKGLDLSEAQRDQIFEIRHANMPVLREQRKEMRAARKALKALSVQANVDSAKLQEQTDSLGKATAAMAMLRVQSMNQVMGVLTEEQAAMVREKMQKRQDRGQHRHGDKS